MSEMKTSAMPRRFSDRSLFSSHSFGFVSSSGSRKRFSGRSCFRFFLPSGWDWRSGRARRNVRESEFCRWMELLRKLSAH